MSAGTMRFVKFRAVVDDPYDGLMRMVGDAQRFGFALEQVALEAEGGVDRWAVLLALRVPHETDDSCLIARFLRHPTVHSTVLLTQGTSVECVPVARLAA